MLSLSLTGCIVQQPISREPAKNNTDYKVDYLFEHDGCKVYRFWDRNYFVYFTNCNGQAIARTDSTVVRNSTSVNKP